MSMKKVEFRMTVDVVKLTLKKIITSIIISICFMVAI